MTVREIYDAIDRIAPFQTAMDFDNVGILVGDENVDVTKTLLCLDVTPRVLREAKSIGVELIISHHPVIFNPLRTVQPQNIIYALVQSGIAVISAHTNLDMAYPYGVNDALCRKLGLQNVRGILKEGETDIAYMGELPEEMTTDMPRDCLLGLGEELSRMVHSELPGFIQSDLILAAREERHAEILLQMLHRARDGRRGEVEFLSDPAQRTKVGKGRELLEFVKIDHARCSFTF